MKQVQANPEMLALAQENKNLNALKPPSRSSRRSTRRT